METSIYVKHKLLFNAIIALVSAGFTYFVTGVLPYYPIGWRWLIVFTVAVVSVLNPKIGTRIALFSYILPIAYNSLTLVTLYAMLLLLLSIFGMLQAYQILVLMGTTFVALNPRFSTLVLAFPLLSGYIGAGVGSFLASIACFLAESIGLLQGKATVGLLTLGVASKPLLRIQSKPVTSLADFGWLKAATTTKTGQVSGSAFFSHDLLSKLFAPFIERPILLAQIILWAATAGVFGAWLHGTRSRSPRNRLWIIGVTSLGLGIGNALLSVLITGNKMNGALMSSTAIGIVVAVAAMALSMLMFSSSLVQQTSAKPISGSHPRDFEDRKETYTSKEIPPDMWNELAGIEDIREEVVDAIKSQFDQRVRGSLIRMGISPTRGILLFGPPGTGKTKIARIIAHEAKASFYAVSGTEFTSMWYGQSEANLRRIFEEAHNNRPSILFFDELEAFLAKRTELSRSDAPEKGIVGTFLSYTDGLGKTDGVLLVGATNHPELIDPAALRPGRFDKIIYVSPPGKEARAQILRHFLSGKPIAQDVDVDKIAERMERFTGADIQAVYAEAARSAMKRSRGKLEAINSSDFETALTATKPSVTIKMLREYETLSEQFMRRSKPAKVEEVTERPVLGWKDVAGLEDVKEALHEAIEMPLTHPELFKQYGVKATKGILLFGPPGCGKTFLAKVVASEAKAHFIHVKGPELLKGIVGESESRMRDLFVRARENIPCVLFFDEIDSFAGARGTSNESSSKILTQFLTEMDGTEELKSVVVLGATNRPDTLDPALLRPGRFDKMLYVPPPDKDARIALFVSELKNKPMENGIGYEELADATDGYSAADIKSICNAAAMSAAKVSLKTGVGQSIATQELVSRIGRTPPSLTREETDMYDVVRKQFERQ